ncbi:MAG: DNA-directed DNA polymerase II small subunit [Nanoarchaeota archaeon]
MKEIIDEFLKNGYLLNPKLVETLKNSDYKEFLKEINKEKQKPFVLNDDIKNILNEKKELVNINWQEFDKARVLFEKQGEKNIYNLFLNILKQNFEINLNNGNENDHSVKEEAQEYDEGNLIILKNYNDFEKKRDVESFTGYFRQRYNILRNFLVSRQELQNAISINKLNNKSEYEKVALIGLVSDKRTTKNKNILITLEDPTGTVNVVISKTRTNAFKDATDILLDEVIGVTGVNGDKIIFGDKVYFPDIPSNNLLKKSNKEEYAIFTSDMQVGNKLFFEKSFLKFIDWLNLKYGDEKLKDIAKKIKYLFIAGDVIEGVGVYPGQDEDLLIQDLYKQYEKFSEYISKIRKDIKIIISPGNHDCIQIAEPQPIIEKNIAPRLHEQENVYLTTNPSLVNIASTRDFPGFNVLIYHGFSFPYIAENVDSIRKAGRLERPDLIMKFLLQKRHLAPSHSSTLYLPNEKEDPLIIEKIPDFFISGHLHKTIVGNYRNITTMNTSCWIDQTEDQERRGIVPDPCKVILVNLKTREVKVLNFKENE